MAGVQGFEPQSADPESAVLPLNDTPSHCAATVLPAICVRYDTLTFASCQALFFSSDSYPSIGHINKCRGIRLAVGEYLAAFEAEPVNGTNDEEDEERKLENGNAAQYRNIRHAS